MSVYIRQMANGEFTELPFSNGLWSHVLDMAQAYGWQPAGTEANTGMSDMIAEKTGEVPELVDMQWDGNYTSNDYQQVADHDAANMAAALRRCPEVMSDDYLCRFVDLAARGGFTIA